MNVRIDRRTFVALSGAALAAPRTLLAQPAKRVYRIATLDDAVESARDHLWRIFRDRLRELVLADGKDVAFEARFARGATERLPALAVDLVNLKPDIIVTAATPATIAVKTATSSIPIVFIGIADPVRSGLVTSLARPGGNATGTSSISSDVVGKLLELLREISPRAKRLAFLVDASNLASVLSFRQAEEPARALGVTIRMLDARERAVLEQSFETIKREGVQGLIVGAAGILLEHRDQIVPFAARNKLPAIYARREYVDVGGLLSYGWDVKSAYLRSADIAHRILRGAKPSELPVERPTSLTMVVNLKTAGPLGIKIPESVRLRANEVIE